MTITAKIRKGLRTATITMDPAAATVTVQAAGSTTRITKSNADQAAQVATTYLNSYTSKGWKIASGH